MTNDQKFVCLMNQADELLKTLDKVDQSNGKLFTNQARQERKKLKILIMQNRIIEQRSTARKRDNRLTLFSNNQNWLAQ